MHGEASKNPKGGVLKYLWTKTEGPDSVKINNPASANPTFTFPPAKDFKANDEKKVEMQLQVTNKDKKIDTDIVEIKTSCLVDIYASAFLPGWTPKGRIPNPSPFHDIVDEIWKASAARTNAL